MRQRIRDPYCRANPGGRRTTRLHRASRKRRASRRWQCLGRHDRRQCSAAVPQFAETLVRPRFGRLRLPNRIRATRCAGPRSAAVPRVAAIDAIYAIVERDPGLRFADASAGTDQAALAVRSLPNMAVRVGYSPSGDTSNFVPLGTFANPAKAMQFALDHELDRGAGIEHLPRKFAEVGIAKRDMARLLSKASRQSR